jgi:hypothetical protein
VIVSDDYQGTVSKCSGGKSIMDGNNIPVADTLPCLYGAYRILIGQSEACKLGVSFRIP